NAAKNLPKNFAPRLNPRPSQSSASAIELEIAKNCSTPAQSGSSDKAITGYKVPVHWNWTGIMNEWASNAITLASAALSAASTFSCALQTPMPISGDIYLQLGVSADDSFESESSGSIPTWKISDSSAADVLAPFNTNNTGWQIIKVALKDTDRVQCAKNKNARIVVVNKNGAKESGTIYFGPYEIGSQGIYTIQDDAFTVTAMQTRVANPGASRFNKSINYAQELSWSSAASDVPNNPNIALYKYFKECDHSDYNEINMYFNIDYSTAQAAVTTSEENGLSFLLDTDAPTAGSAGKIAVYARLSKSALDRCAGAGWRLLTIDKGERKVKIDGLPLPAGDFILMVNNSVIPSRAKIEFSTLGKDVWRKSGTFRVDEIFFSQTSPHFIAQDKNSVDWKKDGVIVESKSGSPIISDVKFHAASQENVTFYSEKSRNAKGDISADASASATIANIALSASAARAADASAAITNAAHSIRTASPLFKTISFGEEYTFDRDSKSAVKENSLSLDFNSLGAPISLRGAAKTDSSLWSLNTKNELSAGTRLGSSDLGYALNISTEASQKLLKSSGEILSTDNYFATWLSATKKEFSFGEAAASKRKVAAKIENTFYLPWSSLAPQINYLTEENYSAATNYYYTDKNSFTFAFPFKVGKNSFSVSWKKSSGGVEATTAGGSYSEDIWQLAKTYNQRKHFFAALPVYDLISWDLANSVHQKTKGLAQNDSLQSEF
ncbi:MAG: hypothetical protein IJR40_03805, partial [Treponema sp.]|nr:hypothetical protein [Treponema sp.]